MAARQAPRLPCAALAAVLLGAAPALAETLVVTRTVRAGEVLAPQDLAIIPETTPGSFNNPAGVIGMEARVALYAGRPLRQGDVGPPALVERNQIVTLVYRQGGLRITTDARALGRAGAGEAVRAMNLASRSTISAVVGQDGTLHVSGSATPDH
ncbi:flagellar basal body P-ring formation chaperone FlgA [Alkalilacustris brevis]|uniref:flagellar basal body P-ring formation chaperone FlgA n=1 Tax=Alkalilacustris brevis TaxID=2026338 RepID=UPI000E0CE661|nr:flagellar basal body P-ring formation chaperone FlgA [Alkalilacustris brevis]